MTIEQFWSSFGAHIEVLKFVEAVVGAVVDDEVDVVIKVT